MDKEKVEELQVSEKELEALLVKDLTVIDPSLVFLGRQIETDSGFLDMLALDKEEKSLVLLELKIKQDDEQLFQAIRYYDWVKSRIELIRRSYRKEIDVKTDPWLILIAPSFSEDLKKVARYVSMPLNLCEYTVLKLPNGEKYVYCKDIDYGEPYEPKQIPTIDGHLNYIQDETVRSILSSAVSTFRENGIEVQPRKRKINLLSGADRIGTIRCRRSFFKIKSSLSGEESGYKYIYNQKDWDAFYKKEIKPYV